MTNPRTIEEARAFLAVSIDPAGRSERVPLATLPGRVLAERIVAPKSLPQFDCAAMDGFAVRQEDLAGEFPISLPVTQTIAAGKRQIAPLLPGTAAQIMTGAPVPAGADRVIVQEVVSYSQGRAQIPVPPKGRANIRGVGEDLSAGSVVLEAGVRLGAGQIALLAGLGFSDALVWQRPKVALVSTGDELCEPGSPLGPGQIHDSNRPMLRAFLEAHGAEVTDLGILRDAPELILETLVGAAPLHDLIITSGGASEGFADHLAGAVSRRGCLEFWNLDMRPGKPVGFGDIDHCPILMLPGNPFAAAAAFHLLGPALLERLQGLAPRAPVPLRLPLHGRIRKPPGRLQVLAARLVQGEAGSRVEPLAAQGSASLLALSQCTVLILLDADVCDPEPGDIVDVLPVFTALPVTP